MSLVTSYRHDQGFMDLNTAKSEAAKLHEAIEKKQLHNDDVVWILEIRNFFQLEATFGCYKQRYNLSSLTSMHEINR